MNLPMPPRLYDRVRRVMTPEEWAPRESTVDAILRLKQERNAVILAHNYQTPDIYHCVSDIVGDSLALARRAAESDADVILVAGVHFMAETAKLLNPDRTVLMPDPRAGCSLAESITAADVRALKEKYPGVPVVTYVNTSAEVKAECDICCTSSNAVRVVESLGVDRVLLVPDEFLARNVARQTDVEIIPWTGRCEVHERFTPEEIARYRATTDNLVVLAHPECAPEVVAAADHAGSTADMIRFVKERRPDAVMMVTECSMSDNVAAEVPDVTFVRPCNLCPHMKLITLDNIHRALETLAPKVEIPADIARRARQSVERMIAIS